jgi:hypothetical protein
MVPRKVTRKKIKFKENIKDLKGETIKGVQSSYIKSYSPFNFFLYLLNLKLEYNNFDLLLNKKKKILTKVKYLNYFKTDIKNYGNVLCSKKKIKYPFKKDVLIDILKTKIKNYKKTSRTRFIVIPMTAKANFFYNYGHQNIIIIDLKNKTYEIFEPNDEIDVDKKFLTTFCIKDLKDLFKKLNLKLIIYPFKLGFQTNEHIESTYKNMSFLSKNKKEKISKKKKLLKEKKIKTNLKIGYCHHWSLFYLKFRLKYPDIEPKLLINKLLDILERNIGFFEVINNFSKQVFIENKELLKRKDLKELIDKKFTHY